MAYTRTDIAFWPPRGPAQNHVVSTRPITGSNHASSTRSVPSGKLVRGHGLSREPGREDVAVHGVERHLASGLQRAGDRGEDGDVVGFVTVAERAEQAQRDVEARLGEWSAKNVAELLGGQGASPALGLREQGRGPVDAENPCV